MTSVQEHYQQHLGRIYGWMIGDFDDVVEAARQELRAAGLVSGTGRVAVDLGAGPGPHAMALAEAGYTVTALDTCPELLDQLRAYGDDQITCVDDDLVRWRQYQDQADVVLCMGDTLTHLPSHQAVSDLLATVAAGLKPGGIFVTTFRDYFTGVPSGVVRFIPVRTDADRVLTCVLDYGRTTMTVHDVVHERTESGWIRLASSYAKLRLSPQHVRDTVQGLGLDAMLEAGPRGMVRVTAAKPE